MTQMQRNSSTTRRKRECLRIVWQYSSGATKSAFTNRREIVTLRRVIHRHVRNCELRDD